LRLGPANPDNPRSTPYTWASRLSGPAAQRTCGLMLQRRAVCYFRP
jgi:hypothetical protein